MLISVSDSDQCNFHRAWTLKFLGRGLCVYNIFGNKRKFSLILICDQLEKILFK